MQQNEALVRDNEELRMMLQTKHLVSLNVVGKSRKKKILITNCEGKQINLEQKHFDFQRERLG